LPFLLVLKEEERPAEKRFEWKAFEAFKNWPVIAVGLVGLIIFMVIVGANQLINPFLQQELDISYSQAGFITAIWGGGIVLGSLLGGWLFSKLKAWLSTIITLAMVSATLCMIAFLVLPESGLAIAIILVVLFGIAYGSAQTITFALCMRFIDPRIAASMFAILMAFTNIGQGIGLGIGGALSDLVTFKWTFFIFASLNLLVLPFLPSLFHGKNKNTEAMTNL
jgi:predicted MFS family arabinose efflux permease